MQVLTVLYFISAAALAAAHGALVSTGPGTNGVSGQGLGSMPFLN
jgi:hypothetical protein